MRLSTSLLRTVLLAATARQAFGLAVRLPPPSVSCHQAASFLHVQRQQTTRLYSSSGGADDDLSNIRMIGKQEMEEILEDYNQGGREESGYVVLDVRNEDEVEATGKLSPQVITCPLPALQENHGFELHADIFKDTFGFSKPAPDETLVFTCGVGKRAQMAAEMAAIDGYFNVVVYTGGAKEWFAS